MNSNSDFDLDLKFGEKFEGCLADILNRGKVEVKTERDLWAKTGNIAIEVRYKGRPSGLLVTKADYWAHIMTKDGDIKFMVIIPVETLKNRARHLLRSGRARKVRGGDSNESEIVLISLDEIIGNK